MLRILITPEANAEALDAYQWYESHQPGLGEEFKAEFQLHLQKIMDAPSAWPPVTENSRAISLQRFPYRIFYTHSATAITIHCVFHTSRDPQIWRERLGGKP